MPIGAGLAVVTKVMVPLTCSPVPEVPYDPSMAPVVLVSSSFRPRVGGVEEHVLNVARTLRARGTDVVVWTVDQGDDVPRQVDGVPVRVLPCPMPARSVRSLASFALRAPVAAARWAAALLRDRPRVLHVHCFGPNGPWATAAAALARRPLVLTAHGETFMDAHRVFDTSALLRRALSTALRRADVVTACSGAAAQDLARFGADPDAVEVVFNGIDATEPAGDAPPGLPRRYVLALGRLVENKGFDLLVEAFAAARLPQDVHLVVAGTGPAARTVLDRAAARGVADRVHLPGRLDRGQVVTVTAAAVALVVPSRVEAFGIVVLEGWRAGVPVVATTHGGPPEFVADGETGLLVDPTDTAALAAALETVVGDPATAGRIGRAGRARLADFTWDTVVDRYEAGYRRAESRRRKPRSRRRDGTSTSR
jgi:glycogen(starch) synthase